METVSRGTARAGRFALHGYFGLFVIVAAEVLLFSGNRLVGHWFTPIVWTGYILFVDALAYKVRGRSPLMTDRLEFLIVALISVGGWWLFEFYNAPRFWQSDLELWWHYHNLEPNPYVRRFGYDWAFATIFPLLFLTAELFAVTTFKRSVRRIQLKLSKPLMIGLIIFGAVGVVVPLIYPSTWFAPVIWLSFIFLLDPINAMRGYPSLIGDLSRGDRRRLWSLLGSGLVCGFLWEFWNYWALSKWTYTVPYLGAVKIFEMPVLGFLGFPPFAIECWAMYIFVRSLLSPGVRATANDDIFLSSHQ
ncbi:MAG: hypothetical protein ACT4OT_16500 [Acidobacteriota bacterium]